MANGPQFPFKIPATCVFGSVKFLDAFHQSPVELLERFFNVLYSKRTGRNVGGFVERTEDFKDVRLRLP